MRPPPKNQPDLAGVEINYLIGFLRKSDPHAADCFAYSAGAHPRAGRKELRGPATVADGGKNNEVFQMAARKYSKAASKKVAKTMQERKRGTLKSGRSGKTVKSRKQAIAIGLSKARKAGKKVPKKKSG
jgi:Family of unknown function (DUF6496)